MAPYKLYKNEKPFFGMGGGLHESVFILYYYKIQSNNNTVFVKQLWLDFKITIVQSLKKKTFWVYSTYNIHTVPKRITQVKNKTHTHT